MDILQERYVRGEIDTEDNYRSDILQNKLGSNAGRGQEDCNATSPFLHEKFTTNS